MSDDYQQAEGPGGSLGRQPWANNPRSMTDTGDAYQPDEETRARYEKAIEEYALRDYRPTGEEPAPTTEGQP
jgi:hypothetical protein